MMPVVLARVDDRVIHGQTITVWGIERPCDAFLVISDAIASDPMRCQVLKMAAGDKRLGVFSVEDGVEALAKAQASNKRFYVISDTIQGFEDLKRLGGNWGNELNIGNIHTPGSAIEICASVCVGPDDIASMRYLIDKNIELFFQLIPSDSRRSWEQVRSRCESI